MSVFTQKFPINRRALAAAIELLPRNALLLTESYYTNLDGPHPLGIGWNKVQSLRGWMKAAALIHDVPRGGGAELTRFGHLLGETDSTLNHPWTWWALHLQLSLNVDATVYHLLFAHCTEPIYGRSRPRTDVKAVTTLPRSAHLTRPC
jgi:Protein of unknown function (DUF4007)